MSSPQMKEVAASYQLLQKEWSRKPVNLDKCGQLLDKLKVSLTQLAFLPTGDAFSKQELIVARDVLEIGAHWSIAVKDIPSFERYMAQLKCYYFDYANELPESAYKYQLLGLTLLCLLAQNRVAEFHTELELLPPKEIQNNIYIRHPVSLEQYLMEGSYNKVFLSKANVPAESYKFFIDILLDTIREEIGACIEKTYETISFQESARLLFFSQTKQLTEFATKRNWTVMNKNIFKFNITKTVTQSTSKVPADILAGHAIEYARELEMIV